MTADELKAVTRMISVPVGLTRSWLCLAFEGIAMSVNVDPARLRQEIVRRGWSPIDLARAARLSPATVSAAMGGKPIAASSLRLIAKALAAAPPVDVIDRLLRRDLDDRGMP